MSIINKLFKLQDTKFRSFLCSLIPNIDECQIIGIRNPYLKTFAKDIMASKMDVDQQEIRTFLNDLPHMYHEENKLHAYIIGEIKHDKYLQLNMLEDFLPFINNWETCDILTPKLIFEDKTLIHEKCIEWMSSDKTYIKRFAIVTSKRLFVNPLDEELYNLIVQLDTNEYYVQMAIAWYIAECAIYNPSRVINLFKNGDISSVVLHKSIQKIVDSKRINSSVKEKVKLFR